jgi:hypothetical protein
MHNVIIAGLVTYIFTLCATIGGICNNYSASLKRFVKPVQLKIGHGLAGSVVYMLASTTIFLGINQVWTNVMDHELKIVTLVVLFISSFYIVTKSIKTALTRIASMSKK